MEEVLKNIKQEPSVEFLCSLPTFDDEKTLGGKIMIAKNEKGVTNEEKKEKNQRFLCEVCKKSFQFKCNLTRHSKSHEKIQCQSCNRAIRKTSLEKHLEVHKNKNDRKFQYKMCLNNFLTKSNFNKHQKVHKGKQFSCDLCGSFRSLKTNLITHINRHHQKGKYKCLNCRQLFDLQNDLKLHLTNRQMNPKICQRMKESELSCRTCGKQFTTISNRNHHEKIHMDKVECPICHVKLSRQSIYTHLMNHKTKEGEKKFKCSECPMMFWTRQLCSEHEKIHNKFECDHCGAKISRKTYFIEHLVTHFNPQTFDCKDCKKFFSTQSKLKGHIRVCHRSGSKQFECGICKKTFKTSSNLKSHTKVHDPKKTCPFCSKLFSAASYSRHIKSHEDKKKVPEIECDLCGKIFKSKQSMKNHMLIHLNLYPFRCHKCGKVFRRIHHVKSHIASAHMKESGKKYA